jgi:hypothetical protein
MMAVRTALHDDVRAVAVDARQMVDWKHHFKAHPLLWCGGAAAIGFLLVPGVPRRRSWAEAPERELPTRARTSAMRVPLASGAAAALTSLAVNVVTRVATRAASEYLSQLGRGPASHQAAQPRTDGTSDDEVRNRP